MAIIRSANEVKPKHHSLLAMMPCPLKVPVEEQFNKLLETGAFPNLPHDGIAFEGNANQTKFYEKVGQYQTEEQLPDITITPGISSFFHPGFREKFVDRNVFADVADYPVNSRFAEIGLKDPEGKYTVICVNPLVMVADKTRLGDTPAPRSWLDLLDPAFKKRVGMRGQNDTFCETTLLTLMHVYGLKAIRQLGESVLAGYHPAQLSKLAGTGDPTAPAVSIMPYFYAKTIRKKEQVEVIWPEEGAIISPVFLLFKRSKEKSLRPVADFFTGLETSSIYENALFPSLHPGVESKLPENARFLWMGWDLIRNNDMKQTTTQLNEAFLEGFRKGV